MKMKNVVVVDDAHQAHNLVLQHPFVSQPLSRTLVIELLDKVSNPNQATFQDHLDEEEADSEVQMRS